MTLFDAVVSDHGHKLYPFDCRGCVMGQRTKGGNMVDWFWSLRGYDLLLATGAIAAGCIAAIGAVLAGLIRLGNGLFNGHKWEVCPCVDCRQRRYHAHKRMGHKLTGVTSDGDVVWDEQPQPHHIQAHWMSTAQLEPGMMVTLNKVGYKVKQIRTDTRGYLIELTSRRSRMPVIVTIPWNQGNRKYWEPGVRGSGSLEMER